MGSGEASQSPEEQIAKLREQSRTGGAGSGQSGRIHVGGTEAPVNPRMEQFPNFTDGVFTQAKQTPSHDAHGDHGGGHKAKDKDVEEIIETLERKGLDAALALLDSIHNPHVETDFYNWLIHHKNEGHTIPGLTSKHPLAKALDFVLFEVGIPVDGHGHGGRSLGEIFASMEQLYLALVPYIPKIFPLFVKGPSRRALILKEHFTLELAVTQESEDAVFYVSVHRSRRDNFEKQVLSIFPKAHVHESHDGYNVFNQFGVVVGSKGRYVRGQALPIRTGGKFDYDPMNVTLAAFSKITKEGEGAAIQICVGPAGDHLKEQIYEAYKDIKKGGVPIPTYLKWWLMEDDPFIRTVWPKIGKWIMGLFGKKKEEPETHGDAMAEHSIGEKIKSPIVGVNMRLVASARTKDRAEAILGDLEASFGQFENPEGNRLAFDRVKKRDMRAFLRSFIFRTFDRGFKERPFPFYIFSTYKLFSWYLIYMNLEELAAIYHLTIGGGTSSREVKVSHATLAPAPTGLGKEGILLGNNVYANIKTPIHFAAEDRFRHLYTIGQTGTGKTNFLKQMIMQDIENGEGICFIDPHGVDVLDILSRIPPHRFDDLIYFDPAYTERPMGLNMLEYDPRYPEQKTFVVDEMFKIFQKLYGNIPEAMGPMFETYFRNATLLVLEDPETGSTLMDISRVLSDEEFRRLKLSRSRNSVVNFFWEDVAERVRGEGDLKNIVPYITSKFDIFTSNEIMRPIVGQQRSAFDMKDVMDNKKILLVNLAKGRLGDINANLIGLVIVGKILMSALGRSEYLNQSPPPFYLYMDEFQNVTTTTIATILSEARKYKLSLTMAHQFIKQLDPKISDAVFGNVGSMAVFRVGADDAKFLETHYAPTFTQHDLMHIDNYNAYVKLLSRGVPQIAFSMETVAYHSGEYAQIEALKQMSYQRFGKQRDAVEEEIKAKYLSMRDKK